jgi:hypothetical protein
LETWTGQICEEGPGASACDPKVATRENANFVLRTGKQTFHLDFNGPLGSLKGLNVTVTGDLSDGTIHVKNLKRASQKDQPGRTAGTTASLAPIPLLSNTEIVDLKKHGMDDDAVIDYIHHADAVDFDLSQGAIETLRTAGVDDKVVAEMRGRVSSEKSTTDSN